MNWKPVSGLHPRCDECGLFVTETRDVYGPVREDGPHHEACRRCRPELFKANRGEME